MGEHLCYKFKLNQLGDHHYVSKVQFEEQLGINEGKRKKISLVAEKMYDLSSKPVPEEHNNVINIQSIIDAEQLDVVVESPTTVYDKNDYQYKALEKDIDSQLSRSTNPIILDLNNLSAPNPCGSNYVDVKQNTAVWQNVRKFRTTGSRLASIFGFNGDEKYKSTWKIIKEGLKEKDISHIENIKCRQLFEDEAIRYFEEITKSKTERCGFFIHPMNNKFGSSPDALGPAGILIEIKTRAKNSNGPLDSITLSPSHYLQCQLQITCTDAHSCILLSYHPE